MHRHHEQPILHRALSSWQLISCTLAWGCSATPALL
jgi:hypothetical protein